MASLHRDESADRGRIAEHKGALTVGSHWQAAYELDDHWVTGPMRNDRILAEEDLRRLREEYR